MNRGLAENAFRVGIEDLLATIEREQTAREADPYAGAGDQTLHEHDTRTFFFDQLLTLLGWELGAGGDVAEEARIKAGTTKFVDYVGVNGDTRAPVLILEAKAWDKPIISGRGKWAGKTKSELIVAAITHLNNGGDKTDAPVAIAWHDYLNQLRNYVRNFDNNYDHEVSSAVLASGQWLLVFTDPARTFSKGDVTVSDFVLFELKDFVSEAHRIFECLGRVLLAGTVPARIYSAQLPNYFNSGNLKGAYRGLLIRYEKSGAPLIVQRPRILLYPALVVERDDKALFTVIDDEVGIQLQPARLENGSDELAPHIDDIAVAADALLQSCSSYLGVVIEPGELDAFPGFPESSVVAARGLALGTSRKLFVRPVRGASDQWLAVTGTLAHYLLAKPRVVCRSHSWSECHSQNQAIGDSAIGSPSVGQLRAYFVDTKPHHCANRILDQRRENRCHIRAIDARTCCTACVYQDVCWSKNDLVTLPCGR